MADAIDAMTKNAERLSRECQRVLEGQGEATQAAVLADLMSLWLAGHVVLEEIGKVDRPETDKVREKLLADWLTTVRALVPESEKEILARARPSGGRQ
jgi:hypothetical protein